MPASLSEHHSVLSPHTQKRKKPRGDNELKLSAQPNSQSSRACVGFCHSEGSGFNERNQLKPCFCCVCYFMSWRDISLCRTRAPASASYVAMSNSSQLRGPLIAFRHIDEEHKSDSPFCARPFDLP